MYIAKISIYTEKHSQEHEVFMLARLDFALLPEAGRFMNFSLETFSLCDSIF